MPRVDARPGRSRRVAASLCEMRRTWSSLQSALSPSNLCLGRRRGCGGTFPRRGTHARCSCPCLQRSVLACAGSRHRPPRSPKPERAEEVLPAGFSTSSARALACPSHCGQCAASVARPRELQDLYTVARELQESRARYTKCVWSVWGSRLRGFQCKNLAVGQHHTAPEPRTTPLFLIVVIRGPTTCAGPTPGGWKREMIDGRGGSRGGPA